ncbi:MAG: type I glyceraldehyde-3-phosphate dehydrogenase [Flavobacteriales bacterium]|nr:type I glyceraldehyde-3-phosphate dehydrogenase [Flavobacteriales bacterium]
MGKIRIAINGFGRIGRVFTRAIQCKDNIELVAINDLSDTATLAHLLKYDSVHRGFDGTVVAKDNEIVINDKGVKVFNERDPENLPWAALNIDIVIESTGVFRTKALASKHIKAGATKVILSAPAKEDGVRTVVMGINDDLIDGTEQIISNASCTTNCAAPMVKIIDELCGIQNGYITTVHSYTGDQRLHDAPHSDLRRARAAAESIVPTTTGAAKAITKIFPHLHGHMGGVGIRVPVPDGSLTDITCIVETPVSADKLNNVFKEYAEGSLKGIIEYIEDPIVSTDIIGNTHSVIYDSKLTSVIGNMIKVVGWYDNEAGYSNRIVDLIDRIQN